MTRGKGTDEVSVVKHFSANAVCFLYTALIDGAWSSVGGEAFIPSSPAQDVWRDGM